jgi:glutamate N-acetyltransferase / amino-acid N-acetyltransferase
MAKSNIPSSPLRQLKSPPETHLALPRHTVAISLLRQTEIMTDKTITDIEGVFANGTSCGIKEQAPDLAFIYVPNAYASAGAFTRNKFSAPCIHYTRKCLQASVLKAVIINSGNANAATGEEGLANSARTAALAAALLKLRPEEVAVASTGIIGKQLPMDKIEAGLANLLANPGARCGERALEAIMTTDTRPKRVHLSREIGGALVSVAGICKGSGMIAPNMGTMLSFLVTDARLDGGALQEMLLSAVDESFNMTSVDTDTSPNDMALLIATGRRGLEGQTERQAFLELLTSACQSLCRQIAADGEGAHRLIEVRVQGAASRQDARAVAKSVVDSPLVKTALHGADPNWGRIIAAAGKRPECKFDWERVDLELQGVLVFRDGAATDPQAREALFALLKQPEIKVVLDLHQGAHSAAAWGCDLSKGYIDINTHYN